MRIELGREPRALIVHYGDVIKGTLCNTWEPMAMHMGTTDRASVTCQSCIEWLHA